MWKKPFFFNDNAENDTYDFDEGRAYQKKKSESRFKLSENQFPLMSLTWVVSIIIHLVFENVSFEMSVEVL